MSDLNVLETNRKELLLAGAAALLHDMGKCAEAFFKPDGIGFKSSCRGNPHINPHKAIFSPQDLQLLSYWNNLSPDRGQVARTEEANHNTALWRTLDSLQIDLNGLNEIININNLGIKSTVKELILWGRPLISDQYNNFKSILNDGTELASYLGRSHGASHIEKEDNDQSSSSFISSLFGFEEKKLENLNEKLKEVLLSFQNCMYTTEYKNKYKEFIDVLKKNFLLVVGDTRTPSNEVTLYDWSLLVASLYKSAIAGALLGYSPKPNDLYWRLLSIRFDGFGFFGKSNRISDLLARRKLLKEALDNVQNLLEIEYPLGTEIYRDENGSIFVVPGCEKANSMLYLSALKTASGKNLEELIHEEIEKSIENEIIPKIDVDNVPWWGQDPDRNGNDELPPISDHLKPISTFADPNWVKEQWTEGITEDICPVCCLRPQGPSQKAKERKVCNICEDRRKDRSKKWAQSRDKTGEDQEPWQRTIWIDEVADKNGQLALIVGKFDLTEWLNGNLIETLLVVCKQEAKNNYNCISKNPSFARIQRVWRTTQKFWKQIEEEDIPKIIQSDHERVEIKLSNEDDLSKILGNYHAYDAEINGNRITLVWDSESKSLLTAVNLSVSKYGGAKKFYEFCLQHKEIKLYEPGGYGQKREEVVTAVVKIKPESESKPDSISYSYTPIIPLLSEPSSFMILVPANDALKVVEKISHQYELEMSKVGNRLPLLLGAVFFDKRQPFFSVLDAGRRMLDIELMEKEYLVTCSCIKSEMYNDQPPQHLKMDHFKKWHELRFLNGNNEFLHWRVSTVMGDGSTADDWYPYVHVVKDQNNQTPSGRKQFEHPKNPDQHWVHVSEVQIGDTVKYFPSRFTWLHLDTSARRFEAMDEEHIHPLEELERITGLWKRLENLAEKNELTQSKLQAIVSLLSAKRENWGDNSDSFKQLVETTLRVEKLEGVSLDDVISGRLERTFEIYHHILKKKINEKNSGGNKS